jgi:hypothetical protein
MSCLRLNSFTPRHNMLANIRDYFHEKLTRLLYDHKIFQSNSKDPEAKLRLVAISDYFTQIYLKKIHEGLMRLSKNLPQDRTFTQAHPHIRPWPPSPQNPYDCFTATTCNAYRGGAIHRLPFSIFLPIIVARVKRRQAVIRTGWPIFELGDIRFAPSSLCLCPIFLSLLAPSRWFPESQ